MRKIFYPLLLLAVFGAGIWLTYRLMSDREPAETTSVDSNVLLEQVRTVCKLVTIESHLHQRYDETNIREFTVYLPLPSTFKFSKKASLLVTGKVLVGYNMEQIRITADSNRQVIRLSNLPNPEILAIDHTVGYEALDESWFNTFGPEDFTALNENARKVLEKKVLESDLMERAASEGNQMIDVIEFIAASAGWSVEVAGQTVIYDPEQLMN